MKLSFWEIDSLQRQRDIIVVGAGLVGLSAAIKLKELDPKRTILVVERHIIGAAASTRNAGFACFGSVSELMTDLQIYEAAEVVSLVERRRKGIKKLQETFGEDRIGYKQTGACETFINKTSFEQYADSVNPVNSLLGQEIFSIGSDEKKALRFYPRYIFNKEEGQLNTGALYQQLVLNAKEAGIEVIRGITVKSCKEGVLYCSVGPNAFDLRANQVLLATNALTKQLIPEVAAIAVRNQVIISQPMTHCPVIGNYHFDSGYVYFRNVGNRLLIGGARNQFPNEETNRFGKNEANLNYLQEFLKSYVISRGGSFEIEHHWSGLLSGGTERLPIVKRHDEHTVIAARLSGMGVAIGMDIGEQAATMLHEDAL